MSNHYLVSIISKIFSEILFFVLWFDFEMISWYASKIHFYEVRAQVCDNYMYILCYFFMKASLAWCLSAFGCLHLDNFI